MNDAHDIPHAPPVDAIIARVFERLRGSSKVGDADAARLKAVAIASDFAIDTLVGQPDVLARLLDNDGTTPLSHAVRRGQHVIVALLRRSGGR